MEVLFPMSTSHFGSQRMTERLSVIQMMDHLDFSRRYSYSDPLRIDVFRRELYLIMILCTLLSITCFSPSSRIGILSHSIIRSSSIE